MAKENEKKFSGEMNAEELENVAGGWCAFGGKSAPKEVRDLIKTVKHVKSQNGKSGMLFIFKDGSEQVYYPGGE